MKGNSSKLFAAVLILLVGVSGALAQQSSQPTQPAQQASPPQAIAVDEWRDDFDGNVLDEGKWERFTFEGGNSVKVEVREGQLRMQGMGGSRSGVRSKSAFDGDRFIAEATIAGVAAGLPEPGQPSAPGNAILTILFDSSGRNRIEWLLTSDGMFEAWSVVDGKGERLDNKRLGTQTPNPTLSIARKGDDFFFALNGEVGLQKTIKNIPRAFHVMLYGYGSSKNDWDSVKVVVPKKK